MTSRRRLRDSAGGTGHLVAGVVEVVVVGRVRRLVRRQASLEPDPLLPQPREHGDRALTETLQCLWRDRVAGLQPEVGEHVRSRVADSRVTLLRGPSPGVHDAAADRRGTSAAEPVEHEHVGAALRGLDRGTCTRGAVSDDHHVGARIPGSLRHGKTVTCYSFSTMEVA